LDNASRCPHCAQPRHRLRLLLSGEGVGVFDHQMRVFSFVTVCGYRSKCGCFRSSNVGGFACQKHCLMYALPGAIFAPRVVVVIHRAFGWQIMRKHIPLTPAFEHVEDRVEYLSHVDTTRPTTCFGRWDEWFQDRPLIIFQITGVRFSIHASNLD
jgi:hypothetical protein